jgi:small subunit ribosomal protein S24e
MEVKITEEQRNILLKRKEILFEVEHSQTKGTPSRVEIRNKLAEMLKTQPELVYVKRVETKTGTMKARGEANAYETMEQAKLVEPEYIVARNIPSEKKEKAEEKKVEAPPKKPEKAEKIEKPERTEKPVEKKEEQVSG